MEDIRQYKVLSQEQEAALGAAALSGVQLDAATKRAQKIKRFQLEKAVKAELDALKMKVTFSPTALAGALPEGFSSWTRSPPWAVKKARSHLAG